MEQEQFFDGFYEGVEDIDVFSGSNGDGDSETDATSTGVGATANTPKLSAQDAFIYSMRNKGRVDLEYMSELSGLDGSVLVGELNGKVIWADPEKYEKTGDYYGSFTSKQQYLRGNIIKKYERAKELNKEHGLFNETVELLKNALPDAINPEDIHMSLGSTWIPASFIEDFIQELFELDKKPQVEYNEFLGKWFVNYKVWPDRVKNYFEYGTWRMSAVNVLSHILNTKPVKVYDQVPKNDGTKDTKSELNKTETLALQQKEKAIMDAWQDFVHGNPNIERRLQEIYMESYGYSITRYDGSFLDLPGLDPNTTPYKHQLDAIARIVLNHNTLLAHDVGSGKTIEYICGVHELIRMGLGHKAIITVPNTTLDAVVNTYKELYPDDNVLAVYPKKNFAPKNRVATLKEMESNKYQVIIMPFSSFDMITPTPAYIINKHKQRINECNVAMSGVKDYHTRWGLETEKHNLRKKLKKLEEKFDEASGASEAEKAKACFDKLGVDILVVDEAHNYKNVKPDTTIDGISGIVPKGSKKADNMLDKVSYIQSIDGHVIFATGTPLTNSMADLYVLQRYLQPNELALCKLSHFNDWVSTFASQEHTFEIDVDSKNFRYTTRFSKFHNLPELMSMFSDVCDFYQIGEGELGLPNFDGYTDVVVKKSPAQKAYIDDIADRTDRIRSGKRHRRAGDNLLLITVDGRKCALDIRLVDPNAVVSTSETKVGMCASNMAKLYFENPGTTQIAFSDTGTPKDSFNIYDELKSELVGLGIPASEIAFIHDADSESKRTKLEKQFNKGEVRILIGSTAKLGTGSNVQERLLAVHHLDVPWRPADMVQREGRIIRQGNTNSDVYIYRYCTEASFDAYTWQILENKQRFIAQFLSGSMDSVHRDESDCADTVLTYAEIKALAIGNPLIKKRVEVANELEHARINHRQRNKELIRLRELVAGMPNRLAKTRVMIENAKADGARYQEIKCSVSNEVRAQFGEELLFALDKNYMCSKDRVFDTYQGFDIILPKRMGEDKPYIIIEGSGDNIYTVDMKDAKPLGCSKRIDNFLEHMDKTVATYENNLADLKHQQKNALASIAEGNEYEAKVDELVNKLADIDKKLEEEKAS